MMGPGVPRIKLIIKWQAPEFIFSYHAYLVCSYINVFIVVTLVINVVWPINNKYIVRKIVLVCYIVFFTAKALLQ